MFQNMHESYQVEMFLLFSQNPLGFINRLDSQNLEKFTEWLNEEMS